MTPSTSTRPAARPALHLIGQRAISCTCQRSSCRVSSSRGPSSSPDVNGQRAADVEAKMIRRTSIALAFALVLAAPAARGEGLRRFAVIVGNDSGGRDTRPLLYAKADARKVHDILTRLGGVRGDDAQLVLDGTAQD